MNAAVWLLAADVVAAWLVDGHAPRDAMAAMPALRTLTSPERAGVARASAAAIAGMRRLEFVLMGPRGLAPLDVRARALVLVLAGAVERDEVLPAGASRQFAAATGGAFDFAPLLAAGERLAATADPVLAFARRHSLPDWFAARALARFGGEAEALAMALGAPPPRTVRANLLRVADRDALANALAAEGIATDPARFAATALHVHGDHDLFATAAFRRGDFEQQDEASQLVAAVVAPPPRGKVLDLCAGNGGKTLALAAALGNRGVVAAADVHERRLQALRERARRAGATNLAVHELCFGQWPPELAAFAAHADRVLVDAPCSGTGTWRRRPEARWALDEARLVSLQRTQDELLARAAAALRPGARLVYATCSLLTEENEARIAALRASRPELALVRVAEILGGDAARAIADPSGTFLSLRPDRHGCDGFFAAVLRAPRERR
jgi:16S rRNA (cytosine967-C5)-methyltransferase